MVQKNNNSRDKKNNYVHYSMKMVRGAWQGRDFWEEKLISAQMNFVLNNYTHKRAPGAQTILTIVYNLRIDGRLYMASAV